MKNICILLLLAGSGAGVFQFVEFMFTGISKEYGGDTQSKTWGKKNTGLYSNPKWTKYIVDTTLQVPKIKENDWSYPWCVIKHKDGHFENTCGNTIAKKDTVRLVHHSACYSYLIQDGKIDNKPISGLPFVRSKIKGDTLFVKLFDESASNNEELAITLVKDMYKIDYHTTYVFPYKKIKYEFKNAYLKVNKKAPYKNGEVLKAKLEIEFIERIIDIDGTKATAMVKRIKGTFIYKLQ